MKTLITLLMIQYTMQRNNHMHLLVRRDSLEGSLILLVVVVSLYSELHNEKQLKSYTCISILIRHILHNFIMPHVKVRNYSYCNIFSRISRITDMYISTIHYDQITGSLLHFDKTLHFFRNVHSHNDYVSSTMQYNTIILLA